MLRRSWRAAVTAVAIGALFSLWHEPIAAACGGCFHGEAPPNVPPSEVASVVTDHRMALAVSPTQTVLWDQVQYAGDPRDFAWVLPVRDGARLELAHDEWLEALDQMTRVTVVGPTPPRCPGASPSSSSGGGGGGGCGMMSGASYDTAGGSDFGGWADAGVLDSGVEIVRREVVGPYEAVTLRASDGSKIDDWLRDNGYVIPSDIEPVLARYASEGFDFIALRMRPNTGVRAMRPVRVVTPGADASLPLRMVAAGIGANVGLSLFVVSEGRYEPQNFPSATVDTTRLTWDRRASRSNYVALATDRMAEEQGRTWITEAALTQSSPSIVGTDLFRLYSASCTAGPAYDVPCAADAAADADADADAATDAAPRCRKPDTPCDDAAVAIRGLHASDIWVTKLRAYLPARALYVDLQLRPARQQVPVPTVLTTQTLSDPSADACPAQASPSPSSDSGGCVCSTRDADRRSGGTVLFLGGFGAALALVVMKRWRRRPRETASRK